MAKVYTKKNDTTMEISENITEKQEITLDDLHSNKQLLQKAIDATQKSLDVLNTQMSVIDATIAEAIALGIKTQEEVGKGNSGAV